MIFDRLENWRRYTGLNEELAKAFEFLQRTDIAELPDGQHEIDAQSVYAIILRDEGRGRDGVTLEAHRKYADIQFSLGGTDEIGWKPTARCTGDGQGFDEPNDLEFFIDDPDAWVALPAGTFAIFLPSDAHAAMGGVGRLHKIVVKVAEQQ